MESGSRGRSRSKTPIDSPHACRRIMLRPWLSPCARYGTRTPVLRVAQRTSAGDSTIPSYAPCPVLQGVELRQGPLHRLADVGVLDEDLGCQSRLLEYALRRRQHVLGVPAHVDEVLIVELVPVAVPGLC